MDIKDLVDGGVAFGFSPVSYLSSLFVHSSC